jgi:hypothetical protein
MRSSFEFPAGLRAGLRLAAPHLQSTAVAPSLQPMAYRLADGRIPLIGQEERICGFAGFAAAECSLLHKTEARGVGSVRTLAAS